jgi:predicted metal-dependent peptidase
VNPTAADIVAAARMRVFLQHPYLSTVLFALRPCEAPGLGTMAVDAGWRMYYDPEVVLEWYEQSRTATGPEKHDGVPGVVFHELGHVLREHFRRTGARDKKRANRAQDREINDDVVEAGWSLPGKPLLPEGIGMARGLTFEEYYPQEPEIPETTIVIQIPGCGGNCGGAASNPTDWEQQNTSSAGGHGPASEVPREGPSSLPQAASAIEQEIVLRTTAIKITQHIKTHGKGSVPAGLRIWSEIKLRPAKIDWRKRLASMVRSSLAAVAGACDFTWRRTGRRSLHSAGRAGWPIAPDLHQPVPRVGIVLDTSGSMSCSAGDDRTVLEHALSEVIGIATASGAAVWVYACDADVQAVVQVAKASDLEKLNKGGGGTNMRPGFRRALQDRPDLVVIVTDGCVGSDWPSAAECRGIRVLAALVGENAPRPPAWISFVEAK